MKVQMTRVLRRSAITSAVASALAVLSTPVLAADWGGSRESYKDMSLPAAVPVPAPVPIPEFKPSWYFRFDAGIGVINDPTISDDEFVYGVDDGPGPITGPGDERFADSSWFNGDFNTFFTLGGGVGYYVGGGWRVDATIEKRSNEDGTVYGQPPEYDTYAADTITGNYTVIDANTNGIADTQTRITVDESFKLDGTVWMANAYYDFGTVSGFTPYIGGGVGFVWNEIGRTRTQTSETCDNEALGPSGCETPATDGTYTGTSVTTSETADRVTFAAAAMVGMSYDIDEITAVDVGYRYLYLQGTNAVLEIDGVQSRLEIGDQNIHQVRAGLRFNVN